MLFLFVSELEVSGVCGVNFADIFVDEESRGMSAAYLYKGISRMRIGRNECSGSGLKLRELKSRAVLMVC